MPHFTKAKFWLGGLITLIEACSPAYGQKGYLYQPERREEFALQDLKTIAEDICSPCKFVCAYPLCEKLNFTEKGIEYQLIQCDEISQGSDYQGHSKLFCTKDSSPVFFIEWSKIRKIVPAPGQVRVCTKDIGCVDIIGFKNERQAADFAEALNAYIQ